MCWSARYTLWNAKDRNRSNDSLCEFHCSLAYSALACFRVGMSGSASGQRVTKSSLRGLGACRNADGAAKPANWAAWLFRGYAT
jgi:hypothetical protein